MRLRLAALIPAAGKSSRMGFPKALLPFGEWCALELILETAREVGVCATILVLAPGATAIRDVAEGYGVTIVTNPLPERGRTTSIQCGLRHLPPVDAFWLWSVDHPLVTAEDLECLARAFPAVYRAGKRILLPTHGGRRGHPPLFAADLASEFFELGGDEPARTIVRRSPQRVVEIPVPGRGVLLNMNTPDDYQRCLECWQTQPPSAG
ncbi:MAG: nucleotidyltransferase family protein [Deltaproteobacteria bacterium]|nr:MAG: nucleotidyltransferase family protein [Deltaproteobacteria bacterium]